MTLFRLRALRPLGLLLATAVFGLGCSSSDGDSKTQPSTDGPDTEAGPGDACEGSTPFRAGMTATTPAGVVVGIESSDPAPPAVGDNSMVITLEDADGEPMVGAAPTIKRFMPKHGHPGVKAIQITDQGGGRYSAAPVNFNMDGLWEMTVIVGSGEEGAVFSLCVE
jgi:hypothetical protein